MYICTPFWQSVPFYDDLCAINDHLELSNCGIRIIKIISFRARA